MGPEALKEREGGIVWGGEGGKKKSKEKKKKCTFGVFKPSKEIPRSPN